MGVSGTITSNSVTGTGLTGMFNGLNYIKQPRI